MNRFPFSRILCILTLLIAVAPMTATAETLRESVERQIKLAETDRGLLPAYAITAKALESDREFPNMPAHVIQRARGLYGTTWVRVGESEATIKRIGDIVTFTIAPSESVKDDGIWHNVSSPDPIDTLIAWVQGARSEGIVFAKQGEEFSMAVPTFGTCNGSLFGEGNPDISTACKRFDLGRDIRTSAMFDTGEAREAKEAFLASLMKIYGWRGVLNRERLQRKLQGDVDRFQALIDATNDGTGYIVYRSGRYHAVTGHLLAAHVHSDCSTRPGGMTTMTVNVYSQDVATARIDLRYRDGGEVIGATRLGNTASAMFSRQDMIPKRFSSFEIVRIRLPEDVLPGTVEIVASAVNASGRPIVDREVIGTFAIDNPETGDG